MRVIAVVHWVNFRIAIFIIGQWKLIDLVNVFRLPGAVPSIARDAVTIGAKCLWLQFGVISQEGADIAAAGGMDVVMDRCIKVEHARYRGRIHWPGLNTGRISARRAKAG